MKYIKSDQNVSWVPIRHRIVFLTLCMPLLLKCFLLTPYLDIKDIPVVSSYPTPDFVPEHYSMPDSGKSILRGYAYFSFKTIFQRVNFIILFLHSFFIRLLSLVSCWFFIRLLSLVSCWFFGVFCLLVLILE